MLTKHNPMRMFLADKHDLYVVAIPGAQSFGQHLPLASEDHLRWLRVGPIATNITYVAVGTEVFYRILRRSSGGPW